MFGVIEQDSHKRPTQADPATVLIVEDEFLIGLDMEAMLQDCGYITLGPCDSVVQALDVLDSESVDAAVLDFEVRDGDTIALAKRLIEHDTPFIFSTGRPERIPDSFADRARVQKPCGADELRDAVAALLDPGPRPGTG